MPKVKIITDSTSDLTAELYKNHDIAVVPLNVIFDDEEYQDGVTITTEEIYKKVEETGKLPKTAAASPAALEKEFRRWYDDGYDIVFTGISSKMSRTYESACQVAREIDPDGKRIFIVDSGNLSTGIGLIVMKAVMDRNNGKSAEVIAERMRDVAKRVKSQFAIEQMDYLHKGGRCSSVARFVGSVLKMKPIIFVRDGAMSVGKKPIGKMRVALDAMLKMLIDDRDKNNVDPQFIFVTDSIAEESRAYLLPKVKEVFPNATVIPTIAGGVIASHCGPGTIGILYICKNEVHL